MTQSLCYVDVDGETYLGQEQKTKKDAEISAAKAAYGALRGIKYLDTIKSRTWGEYGILPLYHFNRDFGFATLKIEAEGEEGWDDKGKMVSCPSRATLSSPLCPLDSQPWLPINGFSAKGS
ncbi:hypothetical protein C1H46_032366 [Malus baccata]|uniref:DRBM domain-containing protein n=1 Tax=Malus baccata TaxID=106549 RepID=A0A540L6H9_MALBA|nr:hypothetical protein C1H46_032366 [Malus baccata]